MVTEQMRGLLNELEPISANAVMMAFVSPFPFGEQPKNIANTWGLICGTRRRIINEPNKALWQKTHLHQLIYPHASRGQQFQGKQTKSGCRIERFHRDEGSTTACLCLLREFPPSLKHQARSSKPGCLTSKGATGSLWSSSP